MSTRVVLEAFDVGNGSAECSNTTTETPHEFFDQTGTKCGQPYCVPQKVDPPLIPRVSGDRRL